MSEHVLPKGMFYLLLWKRLNQSGHSPAFSFNDMIEHLHILYDESVFDNPELPESNDHDFEWDPIHIEEQPVEKELIEKMETAPTPPPPPTTPTITKTRKRATSPSSVTTPNSDTGRRSSRQQRNIQTKDDDDSQPSIKIEKRKSLKDSPRPSTRLVTSNDSIGTRLRGQK